VRHNIPYRALSLTSYFALSDIDIRINAREVFAVEELTWLINGSVSALGVGFLAFISREFGAKNYEAAAKASAQSVLAALTAGLLFTILPLSLSRQIPRWMQVDPAVEEDASLYFFILYCPMIFRSLMIICGTVLRACGDTRTPMLVNTGVNVLNAVGNFLMIYPARTLTLFGVSFTMPGAGLGVAGAALASAASITLGGLGMIAVLYAHPTVSPRGHSLKPDWAVLRPCLKVALPSALQRFTTSFGYVAFASMINGLGAISMAAHSIANTAESAFYIPGYGMQTAASTLIGNAYGQKNPKRMRELTRTMLILEVAIMILSGALLFFLAEPMMRLFTSDSEVISLGAAVLRMVAVTEPAYGVSIVLEGVFMGVGDTMAPFRFNVIGMWGIRIVGTFLMLKFLGLG